MQEELKSNLKDHKSIVFKEDYEQNPDMDVNDFQKEKVWIPLKNDLKGSFINLELEII